MAERGNATIRYALARTGLVTVVDDSPGRTRAAGTGRVDVRAIGRHSGAGSVVVTSARRDRDTLVYDAQIIETLGSRVRWIIPPVRTTVASPGPALDQLAQRVAQRCVGFPLRRELRPYGCNWRVKAEAVTLGANMHASGGHPLTRRGQHEHRIAIDGAAGGRVR